MQEHGAVGDAAGLLQILHECDERLHLRIRESAAFAVADEADADGALVEPCSVGRGARRAGSHMGAGLLRVPARTDRERAIGLAVAVADDEVVAERRQAPGRVLARDLIDRARGGGAVVDDDGLPTAGLDLDGRLRVAPFGDANRGDPLPSVAEHQHAAREGHRADEHAPHDSRALRMRLARAGLSAGGGTRVRPRIQLRLGLPGQGAIPSDAV